MSLLTIQYDEIFDTFLESVTDYHLASLEKSDAYKMMAGWLRKGITKSYVKRLFTTSTFNDDSQIFTFELKHPAKDETDKDQIDFVKGVASKAMVIEWCEPKVNKTTNISQGFFGKEQKLFSQASHLAELRNLLADTKAELRHELGDRGVVINSYLGTST